MGEQFHKVWGCKAPGLQAINVWELSRFVGGSAKIGLGLSRFVGGSAKIGANRAPSARGLQQFSPRNMFFRALGERRKKEVRRTPLSLLVRAVAQKTGQIIEKAHLGRFLEGSPDREKKSVSDFEDNMFFR